MRPDSLTDSPHLCRSPSRVSSESHASESCHRKEIEPSEVFEAILVVHRPLANRRSIHFVQRFLGVVTCRKCDSAELYFNRAAITRAAQNASAARTPTIGCASKRPTIWHIPGSARKGSPSGRPGDSERWEPGWPLPSAAVECMFVGRAGVHYGSST